MTARCRKLAALLLAAPLLLAGVSSCHTSKHAAVKSDKSVAAVSPVISDDWASLQIELTSKDNGKLYRELKSWLGTPYRYGGNTRDGVDCSGLVVQVYQAVYQVKLQRSSARIYERNCEPIEQSQLGEGDLVFFITNSGSRINHVGIYLKDNKFVHASSRGVRVDDLTSRYYSKHYTAAGRVRH